VDLLVDVPSLPSDAAIAHVERLLADSKRHLSSAAAIASEAGGHPQLIEALVWHLRHVGTGAPENVRLETALWSRLQQLPPDAAHVVLVIATAGSPISPGRRVRGKWPARGLRAALSASRRSWCVRADCKRPTPSSRITVRTASQIAPEGKQRELHLALAHAIAASPDSPSAELLAVHWEKCGEMVLALRATLEAAERASRAFAFESAGNLYERALSFGLLDASERHAVLLQLGEARATAGRGDEAARAFTSAAEGSEEGASVELRRRAAEQLLLSGHFERGYELLRAVLATLGERFPNLPCRLLLSCAIRKAAFRDRPRLTRKVLVGIDNTWSARTSS
jgi:hypothetical protein